MHDLLDVIVVLSAGIFLGGFNYFMIFKIKTSICGSEEENKE